MTPMLMPVVARTIRHTWTPFKECCFT